MRRCISSKKTRHKLVLRKRKTIMIVRKKNGFRCPKCQHRCKRCKLICVVRKIVRVRRKIVYLNAPAKQCIPGDGGAYGPQGGQDTHVTRGPQGLPREQGTHGTQGVSGPEGPPGPQGVSGPQGTPGEQGSAGLQGPPGPRGEQGPLRPFPNIAVIPSVTRYYYITGSDWDLSTSAVIMANLFADDAGIPVTVFSGQTPNSYHDLFINGMLQEGSAYHVNPDALTLNSQTSANTIYAGTPITLEVMQFFAVVS